MNEEKKNLSDLYEQRKALLEQKKFTFTIDKEIEEAEMDVIQSRMKELAEAANRLFKGIESDYKVEIIHSPKVGTRTYVRPERNNISML